ncbi:MAG: SUMF1/EgtB/PvdO family nonheme iron enzyme [Prosthecobacter sp.]
MSNDAPTPPEDGFPQGRATDMQDILLSPQSQAKPATSNSSASPWMPPTAEELGKLLPDYEIVKMLGRGGMGAVYMGRQKSLDRPVAIKILSTALEDADPSFAERFKNEARAMAKLNHPGIVAVHDFGEAAGGLLYIVMEYVEGTDVAKMIAKDGRLHTEHAMAITAHVCDALSYAHDRGIIHRDIKPANIMVGYDGVVKVADFGLAKMTHTQNTGLTQSGMAMGTLHYMAPEALMLGSAVDHRADIYAVGVMLYQMLTGKIPQGMFELPSLQVKGLDPRYDGIIAKSLREDREARYQSVRDMRHDLDGILTQPVVKVEEDVSQTPAALSTDARPQKPGVRQPQRPKLAGEAALKPPQKKSHTRVVTAAGVAVLGALGWFAFKAKENATIASAPATTGQNPPLPADKADSIPKTTQPSSTLPASDNKALFRDWQQSSPSRWRVEDAALVCDSGENEFLYRSLTSPGFELSGEVLMSPDGNGGIHFHIPSIRQHTAGFELQFCGSTNKQKGVGAGGLFTYAIGNKSNVSGLSNLLPDNTFVPFRLLVEKDRIQAWLGGRQTVDLKTEIKTLSDSVLALSRWGPTGKAAYRNLALRPLPVASPPAPGQQTTNTDINQLPTGPTTWTDTQGRSITATFKNIASDNVLLDIAGKITPVPLNILSAESQKLARDYQKQVQRAPSDATKDSPFANSLGMKFVPVPGTKVLFCIHETRRQDYQAYALANPSIDSQWQAPKFPSVQGQALSTAPDHPVVKVNRADAIAFCDWLTTREGLRHRLPTDREWSCAAGIEEQEDASKSPKELANKIPGVWPYGIEFPPTAKVANYADTTFGARFPGMTILNGYDDGWWGTAPVMSYPANPLGLYDLGGNVWELCDDFFDESGDVGVIRGAAYDTPEEIFMGSSHRGLQRREIRKPAVGFRVVLELPATTTQPPSSVSSPVVKPVTPMASLPVSASPSAATKHHPFVNSLGMKFVPVPGTRVLFCVHETRRQDYQIYMSANSGANSEWEAPSLREQALSTDANHPVVKVNRADAIAFCDWLTARDGLRHRLPTDREWSCAAGIGEREDTSKKPRELANRIQGVWPYGIEYPPKARVGNYADTTYGAKFPNIQILSGYDDGWWGTAPVMSYPANSLGLHDLGGNVRELCDDFFDQSGLTTVLRGAAFDAFDEVLMGSSHRGQQRKDLRKPAVGFRVVIELPTP